jgi:aminoglycoside phosphotransferase (APT) family kinase protein
MADDPAAELAADLTAAMAPHAGRDVVVTAVEPLSSGASRQSWRFSAGRPGRPGRSYVLQREMVAGGGRPPGAKGPLAMRTQGRLLQAAEQLGVPVPRVVASGEQHGRQYLITAWLGGEALPPKLLRDPDLVAGRARLLPDCAGALAGIHRIVPDPGWQLEQEDRLAVYRSWLDLMGEPRPALELGYRWLVRHRPDPGPAVVVHGDFRLGNLLVDAEGLRAVLDWELAHIGDRHEDLAWPTIRAWRFDRYRQPGTFPEPDAWLAAYTAAAGPGAAVDPDAFRWWQIAGTWMWAVMSGMQARRHLDGWVASLEHAAIGRRVCESEWDLLELLP